MKYYKKGKRPKAWIKSFTIDLEDLNERIQEEGGIDLTIGDYLGEIIAEAREKKGLSQRQLAKLAKINNSELSKIEAGIRKDPSPRILRKISSIIDVNYSDLMYSIGLGLEVTPLNYFIKNHYSNLNAEELETAEINVLGSIENSEKLVE